MTEIERILKDCSAWELGYLRRLGVKIRTGIKGRKIEVGKKVTLDKPSISLSAMWRAKNPEKHKVYLAREQERKRKRRKQRIRK